MSLLFLQVSGCGADEETTEAIIGQVSSLITNNETITQIDEEIGEEEAASADASTVLALTITEDLSTTAEDEDDEALADIEVTQEQLAEIGDQSGNLSDTEPTEEVLTEFPERRFFKEDIIEAAIDQILSDCDETGGNNNGLVEIETEFKVCLINGQTEVKRPTARTVVAQAAEVVCTGAVDDDALDDAELKCLIPRLLATRARAYYLSARFEDREAVREDIAERRAERRVERRDAILERKVTEETLSDEDKAKIEEAKAEAKAERDAAREKRRAAREAARAVLEDSDGDGGESSSESASLTL